MSEHRCQQAVQRIEAALDRIASHDAAARHAAPASDPGLTASLTERHERLRNATRSAIAELDALIGAR